MNLQNWKDTGKNFNNIINVDCITGLKEIDENSIDLIITDPPYNTGMNGNNTGNGRRFGDKIKKDKDWLCSFFNDDLNEWDYEKLMKDTIKECFRILKPNKPAFLFIDFRNFDKIKQWLEWGGFNYKQALVWDKVVHGLNYQNYAYSYELIIFAVKGEDYHPKRIHHKTDIIRIQRVNMNNEMNHEIIKPIKLIRELIEDNSNENDIVLDCFMGSGTTAVACQQINRKYIGFELNGDYCKIAENRLAQKSLRDYLREIPGKVKEETPQDFSTSYKIREEYENPEKLNGVKN